MTKTRFRLAVPPGATIKEQLEERGMSQKAFAARMNMSEKHISKLINGDVQLTYEVAVRLEIVLGPPASFWNSLEAAYRERLMQDEYRKQSKEEAELVGRFPYTELVRAGWLPESRDSGEKTENLRRFFEMVNLCNLNNELVTQMVSKKLSLAEKKDLELISFAQKAKLSARDRDVNPLNIKKLISAIPEIKACSTLKNKSSMKKLSRLLLDCGIVLIFLPKLDEKNKQRATFYDGNKLVIGFSEGMEEEDNFWRELFHELGHIILGHLKIAGNLTDEDDEAAYDWADNTLIDYTVFSEYRNKNDFSEKSIIKLSVELDITPRIITERLRRERLINYSVLINLEEKKDLDKTNSGV
jgi:HTH-type transcriptional regulator/antitoxin HigA